MIYQISMHSDANLHFEIALEKNKQVYCFFGEPAVGKTNLLENLAKGLLLSHSRLFEERHPELHKVTRASLKNLTHSAATQMTINEKKLNVATTGDWFEQPREFEFDKPLVFIGARNRGYTNNIDPNHIKILGGKYARFLEAFKRSFSYMNGQAVEDTQIADWFNARLIINPQFVVQNQDRVFEVTAVLELMQKLDSSLEFISKVDGKINIKFSEGGLYFNSIALDKFSTGLVSIIKIFQEIIGGYGGWSGLLENVPELTKIEGIVFIDEIDSHLHPKWQGRLLTLLRESFPNTTFYIATHSPLIVSTTAPGEAYELVRTGHEVTAHKLATPKEYIHLLTENFHVELEKPKISVKTEAINLIDLLDNFSSKVKDYVNQKDPKLKQESEELYQKLLLSLPHNDPRRRSVEYLWELLQ